MPTIHSSTILQTRGSTGNRKGPNDTDNHNRQVELHKQVIKCRDAAKNKENERKRPDPPHDSRCQDELHTSRRKNFAWDRQDTTNVRTKFVRMSLFICIS